mmetsp:Transcript_14906/g.28935  ORF Transcript_14906/g.28935 Transcript_14906/m.28935 type:complete len:192 (+) Transcript_14906:133-708(+)
MDQEETRDATAALQSCEWFNELLDSGEMTELERPFEALEKSHHFVAGRKAPFKFRYAVSEPDINGKKSVVVAVYFGRFATNTFKMVHGGAVSAVLDFITAISGVLALGASPACMTRSLEVRFRQPTPLGCVRINCNANFLENGELLNTCDVIDVERGIVTAVGKAVLVDLEKRKQQRSRDAEQDGTLVSQL